MYTLNTIIVGKCYLKFLTNYYLFKFIFLCNKQKLTWIEIEFRLGIEAARTLCHQFVQTDDVPMLLENCKLKTQLEKQKEKILKLKKEINKFKSKINRSDTELRNLKESIVDSTDLDVRWIVVIVGFCL